MIDQLLKKREWIKKALEAAASRKDFEDFMEELMRGLEFNCEATKLFAGRFLQLVQEDCVRVQEMLQRIRSKDPQLK
jgi:hypothetical protein